MTDKELLIAAARAAGLPAFASGATGLRVSSDGCASGYIWNPLTDDGDALRLACKLAMAVSVCTDYTVILGVFEKGLAVRESHEEDPYAATRRAIVRAAAEIGSLHNALYRAKPAP